MNLPSAPESILENVNCGCKSGCRTKCCSCLKAKLKCTTLYSCSGCTNSTNEHDDGNANGNESVWEDNEDVEDEDELLLDEDEI